MSAKFASITADLLARKGGAMPSAIAVKPVLDWTAPVKSFPHKKPAHEIATEPHHHDAHGHYRDDVHYLRKIQIGLSDHDHERLRILSARREASRQQIVRDALADYFEKQAQAYGGECHCLSNGGTCQNGCIQG